MAFIGIFGVNGAIATNTATNTVNAATGGGDLANLLSYWAVLIAVLFVITIISFIYRSIVESKKKEREEKLIKIAKISGADVKTNYNKPIKDGEGMECFACLKDPCFTNVIEKLDKENGDVYIGELEWFNPSTGNYGRNSRNPYSAVDSTDTNSNLDREKNYSTMCVLYDNGFNLPNFDLTKETIDKKAFEFLKMNDSEDIDFDEDNEFSDAWWLSSSENVLCRELFTQNIRSSFMKYIDKGYRISGQKNMLIIITDSVIQPEDYPSIISDNREIAKFLKTNNKFYKKVVKEEKKDSEPDKSKA